MMKIRCLGLVFAVLFFSHAIAENKNGQVAEFCAKIGTDNSYELYLLKNIRIPTDSNWIIPDSVEVGCSDWYYNYFVDAPEDEKMDSLLRMGFHACFGGLKDVKKKTESLKTELVKGSSCLCYYLKNAKKSLKPYYGKELKGTWFAELYNTEVKLSSDFMAVIVGECSVEPETFEFCVESRSADMYGLHLVREGVIEPYASDMGEIYKTKFVLDAPSDSSGDFQARIVESFDAPSLSDTSCRNLKMSAMEISPVDRDRLHFHLKDALNSIVRYYWKPFKGMWEFKSNGGSCLYRKSFDAVIVGPCAKNRVVAEYCFDNKRHSLTLKKELDYIPRHAFQSEGKCIYCDDSVKRRIMTKIDYGKGYVSVKDGAFERKGDDYLPKEWFYLPNNVKNMKSLNDKILPAKLVLEIQDGKNFFSESYDFSIRVSGPCEE